MSDGEFIWDPKTHWRMRDGGLIEIDLMTSSHLGNALRMLHRAANAWMWKLVSGPGPNGEMAEEGFEHECDQMAKYTPSELLSASPYSKRSDALLAEWAKRGFPIDGWCPSIAEQHMAAMPLEEATAMLTNEETAAMLRTSPTEPGE